MPNFAYLEDSGVYHKYLTDSRSSSSILVHLARNKSAHVLVAVTLFGYLYVFFVTKTIINYQKAPKKQDALAVFPGAEKLCGWTGARTRVFLSCLSVLVQPWPSPMFIL